MGEVSEILVFLFFLIAFPQIAMSSEESEIRLGAYADRQIMSLYTVVFNEALIGRFSQIGCTIGKVSEIPDMKYTFRIINDLTFNAYSAAGGYIYINEIISVGPGWIYTVNNGAPPNMPSDYYNLLDNDIVKWTHVH